MPRVDGNAAARWHLVGVGGAGMRALAEILLADGCAVSGSDLVASEATRRLRAIGVEVRIGHDADAVTGADAVVVSSAIGDANVEVARARELGVPVHARGEVLAQLMRPKRGVAVAGSHGKTTTAAMAVAILAAAGEAPSFAIGGVVRDFDVHGRRGAGAHFIAEADESDASFLRLRPHVAVVTNVDRDHMDAYGQDFGQLQAAFAQFLRGLPPDGVAILCADDPACAALAQDLARPTLSYGFSADAQVRGAWSRQRGAATGHGLLTVSRPGGEPLRVTLPLPGCDNARNALAAIAVAVAEGVSDDAIAAGLSGFVGVKRRFDIVHRQVDGKRLAVVDDYGHHPSEIAGVVATARRLWPNRRIVMAFQPHRYTRLRDLGEEFAKVISTVDELLLVEVYAAFEPAIADVNCAALAQAVARCGAPSPPVFATPEEALAHLRLIARDDDVVLAQGAGDIERVAQALGNAA